MARIENQTEYPVKPSPAPSDFLIGTDSQDSNKSVSFSIGSISETIGATFYTADGFLSSARTVTVPSTLEFPLSTSGSEFLIQRTAGARFRVNDLGIFVGSGVGAFTGMQYEADYSANYVNRSLVDKQYVDTISIVAAGNDKSVQFNNAGVFAGSDNIFINGVGASLNLADNIELYFGAGLDLLLRHNSGNQNNEVISNGADLNFQSIGTPSVYSFELTDSSTATAFQITDAAQANTLFYVDGTGATALGTNLPTTSAILDINSTTKGFLKPRMTTVQRDAIVSPATGLEIYNITDKDTQSYNGTVWVSGIVATLYAADGSIVGVREVTVQDSISFIGTTENLFTVSVLNLGIITFITDAAILEISDTQTVFTDTSLALEGIKYNSDYSATFVARSLVDKGYVDSAILTQGLGFSLTTGVKSGGFLTPAFPIVINFDISDGFGYVVDSFTDPENPVVIKVVWSGLTNLTATHSAGNDFSSIAINSSGTVIQQVGTYTEEQSRDLIVLGTLVHIGVQTITGAEDMSRNAGASYISTDMAFALGNINISGNNFNAASTNLTLRKEVGTTFRPNVNRHINPKNPDYQTLATSPSISWLYVYDDGAGGTAAVPSITNVDPNQYDDGTGVLASVPVGNNWTNQWCYLFPGSNILVVRYGETVYSTLLLAQTAALTEIPTTIGVDFNIEFIRTIISVKQGTADLTNIANAAFTHTGKFGLIGG